MGNSPDESTAPNANSLNKYNNIERMRPMKLRINYNLQCEVDVKKDDCHREPAHCHITRNGYRVAQVWLNPVAIQSGHSLDRNEVKEVCEFVSDHRYELDREYEHNRNYGAD